MQLCYQQWPSNLQVELYTQCIENAFKVPKKKALSVYVVQSVNRAGWKPETHTKRHASQYGCMPSLLSDED